MRDLKGSGKGRSGPWWFLLALVLPACLPVRDPNPPRLPPSAHLVAVGTQHSDPEAIRQVSCRPREVLVLSGGGANGAFTAGVLRGWSEAGTRPVFDVVTGISAGALAAPYAFLGREYDEAMTRSFTGVENGDIFRRRSAFELPWAESLATSAPLREKIEAEVTPELLAAVADAHRRGRRLYVGTTNLDTKRLVVWDLGAIACGEAPGNMHLFRKVLLASASVPGLLPPVPFDLEVDGGTYHEFHVDGGVAATLFLSPAMLGLRRGEEPPEPPEGMRVHVIVAGQLRPRAEPVRPRLFNVAGQSIGGVLQARSEGDLLKAYLLTRYAGASFALTAIPDSFPDSSESLSFDPVVMQALFETGERIGREGEGWIHVPPVLTHDTFTPPARDCAL